MLTISQKEESVLNSAISIRLMESSDLDDLKQITNTSFPRFLLNIATQSRYSEGQVLVGEAQGATVGFIKLAKFHLDGKFGCIFGIAVLKQFRQKGIATDLVKA